MYKITESKTREKDGKYYTIIRICEDECYHRIVFNIGEPFFMGHNDVGCLIWDAEGREVTPDHVYGDVFENLTQGYDDMCGVQGSNFVYLDRKERRFFSIPLNLVKSMNVKMVLGEKRYKISFQKDSFAFRMIYLDNYFKSLTETTSSSSDTSLPKNSSLEKVWTALMNALMV